MKLTIEIHNKVDDKISKLTDVGTEVEANLKKRNEECIKKTVKVDIKYWGAK